MLSRGLLILASFLVIVAVVSSKPWSESGSDESDSSERHVDRKDDFFGWLYDRDDGSYDWDGEKDPKLQCFQSILRSVRNKQDDYKSVTVLFKTFLKVVLQKKQKEHRGRFALSKRFSDHHDDSGEWDDLFDDDEFHYQYDDDLKEEKAKKLFMLYLKFKAQYLAQRDIEKSLRNQEEKARRQFEIFSELIAFVEKVKSLKEEAENFSKFVDSKLKSKFASFKKCFYNTECDKYDDDGYLDVCNDVQWKSFFSVEDYDDHLEDSKHCKLFLKLFKFVKLVSHKRDSHDEEDSFPDFDCQRDDDDDDDWKDKHPVYRFIAYLHKHLSDHSLRDFWEKKEHDRDETYERFLFFALKAFKELKEEKAMQERKEKSQAIFAHFLNFIKDQEDIGRTNDDFYKFRKWEDKKENKGKLDEFTGFLKKVVSFGTFTEEKWDKDELKDKFEHLLDYNDYDYGNDKSDEDYFGNWQPKFGYKERSHRDKEWW